jgi:hypothetical protein
MLFHFTRASSSTLPGALLNADEGGRERLRVQAREVLRLRRETKEDIARLYQLAGSAHPAQHR